MPHIRNKKTNVDKKITVKNIIDINLKRGGLGLPVNDSHHHLQDSIKKINDSHADSNMREDRIKMNNDYRLNVDGA